MASLGVEMVVESSAVAVAAVLVCFGVGSKRISWALTRHVRRGDRIRRAMLVAYPVLAAVAIIPLCLRQQDLAQGWTSVVVALAMGLFVGNLALVVRGRIQAVAPRVRKRVLAVGAHPDDLELACGGTLARLVDVGHDVHSLVMSSGDVGGNAAARMQEAVCGARRLGIEAVEVHDFPDTNLALTSREMTLAIESMIAKVQPDIILTHSAHDQHQDHFAVHQAVLRAARRHHSVMCFESPSVTGEFRPTVFFDIDEYIDIKQGAVEVHQDQIRGDKIYMGKERLQGTAVFRGGQVKRRRAEGFEVVRLLADEAGLV